MEPIKQTGLIFKFSEKDYVAGVNSPLQGLEVKPDGDWRNYLPVGEPQYLYSKFDTMSCTTFSALNVIETWCNYLIEQKKVSENQIATLKSLGYLNDLGKIDFSDRFTAIMSGTKEIGNYFQAVLDSARVQHGLLPEKDFPFGGESWPEYHNKSLITEEMLAKAKKILTIFKIHYEWTPVNDTLFNALKQAPIQCAIPVTATHAVMLPKLDYIFDTYPPFLYPRNTIVAFAVKIFVEVIPESIPEPTPVRTLRFGMSGEDVKTLQSKLKKLKYFVYPNTTTYFGPVTMSAVKKLQLENGLTPDGIVGSVTRAKIEELLNKEVGLVIIQKQTPNFTEGRSGYKPEAIIIHIMDGTLAGTDSWFKSSKSQVSSHYGIGRTGEIHQYVKEEDKAWHSGKVVSPNWSLFKNGVNPNLYTVGIEHEGYANTVWTAEQKTSSALLIKEICKRWNIPIDRDHIIGHYQINGSKPDCPAINKTIIQDLVDLAKVL